MACEKFWIEKLWEFFSQQRRQVSPQGSIHLSRELGIYAYYLPAWPKSSPYMCKAMETPVPDSQSNPIQGTHFLWQSSWTSLLKANFQASILPAMSWLRGLLRCPTCLEVASTCFRDTRSVIKQGFSLVFHKSPLWILWYWCHRSFAKKIPYQTVHFAGGRLIRMIRNIWRKKIVQERTIGPTNM